jgi:dihydropteroate synthase
MFLKKINDLCPGDIDENTHKVVSDLGVAAYLLMHEYRNNAMGVRVVGKKGKYIYFYHPEGRGEDFERLSYEYLPSQFQTYDSNLMALKKIGEYMPRK